MAPGSLPAHADADGGEPPQFAAAGWMTADSIKKAKLGRKNTGENPNRH
jgi:hypothetical protein